MFQPGTASAFPDSVVISTDDPARPSFAVHLSGSGASITETAVRGVMYAVKFATPSGQVNTIDVQSGAAAAGAKSRTGQGGRPCDPAGDGCDVRQRHLADVYCPVPDRSCKRRCGPLQETSRRQHDSSDIRQRRHALWWHVDRPTAHIRSRCAHTARRGLQAESILLLRALSHHGRTLGLGPRHSR